MDTQNSTLFFDVQLENMWKTVKKLIIMFWVTKHVFFFLKEMGELKKKKSISIYFSVYQEIESSCFQS